MRKKQPANSPPAPGNQEAPDKDSGKVTDRPVVVLLVAILAAFVAGVSVYSFFQGHVGTAVESWLRLNLDKIPPGPQGPEGLSVPIGGVIMWAGDRRSLPDGFEVCDGTPPTIQGATFTGTKPDLVDRFPKGAPKARMTNTDLQQGGSNNMPAHSHSKGSLTIPQSGHHGHSPATCDDDHGHERPALAVGDLDNGETGPGIDGGAHSHPIEGRVGSGVDGDGSDTSGANQPAFSEVFFIIRVK